MSCNGLSICHWNLNSIPAHNFKNYLFFVLTSHFYIKFNIIGHSEIYLDSSISSNDSNLEVPGYALVRTDNPNKTKRGGVCIYYLIHYHWKC